MKRQLALLAGALLLGACNPNLTELGRQDPPEQQTEPDTGTPQEQLKDPPRQPPPPATCLWEQTTAPIGAEIRGVYADSMVRLVVTEDVLFRSEDGATWSEVFSAPRPLDHFEMVRFGGALYATTGRWNGGVLRSTDNGATWAELNGGFPEFTWVEQLVTDGTALLARTSGALYQLSAEGTGWDTVATPQPFAHVQLTPGFWLAVDAEGDVLRSTDSGASWSAISGAFAPNPQYPLVRTAEGVYGLRRGQSLVVSKDAGLTWQEVPDPVGAQFGPSRLGDHGGQPMAVYYGGLYRLDAGEWVSIGPVSQRGNGESITHFASDGAYVYAGTFGSGLMRIEADGWYWERPVNLPGGPARAVTGDGTRLYVASTPHEIQVSEDAGATFTAIREGLHQDAVVTELAAGNGAVYAGTGSHGLYRSVDGGASWLAINQGYPQYNSTNGWKHREVGAIAVGSTALVVGTAMGNESWGGKGHAYNSAGLFRSLDGGDTWQPANGGLEVQGFGNEGNPLYFQTEAAAAIGGRTFLMSMATLGLLRSTDDGASWIPVNDGVPVDELGFLARFNTILRAGDAVFAGGWLMRENQLQTILLRSDDDGRSWKSVLSGLPANRQARKLAASGGALFVSIGHPDSHDPGDGVYVSWDGGESWSMASRLAPIAHVGAIHAIGGALFGATDANGLQRLSLGTCQ